MSTNIHLYSCAVLYQRYVQRGKSHDGCHTAVPHPTHKCEIGNSLLLQNQLNTLHYCTHLTRSRSDVILGTSEFGDGMYFRFFSVTVIRDTWLPPDSNVIQELKTLETEHRVPSAKWIERSASEWEPCPRVYVYGVHGDRHMCVSGGTSKLPMRGGVDFREENTASNWSSYWFGRCENGIFKRFSRDIYDYIRIF